MEKNFILVKSVNQVTLEQCPSSVSLSKEDCINYSNMLSNHILPEEEYVYSKIENDLSSKISLSGGEACLGSRRVIITYSPTNFESDWCVSSIHLLFRDPCNSLIVYQRSLSSRFFLSDIGFYSKLASNYDASLTVFIGSFHFIVGNESND